ncbi:hypothetical protein ACFPYN_11865 [Paenisporosarcina macmurdoensis]|uniref:HNH endonuclease n=1 Tax=Paenisporosarcina macmurdoensis TaxID=212659 RepID=A0ABW1LAY3_9BACL
MFEMNLYSMENLNKLKKSISAEMPEVIERIEKHKAEKLQLVRKGNRKKGVVWRKKNPEQSALNDHIRRTRKALLPSTLTPEQESLLKDIQNNKCILSNIPAYSDFKNRRTNFTLEHFIPIVWGVGGTTWENCYYMNDVLNSSKGNRNPFYWITAQPEHIQNNFHTVLVPMMAERNRMTTGEFTTYVNEAYENYKNW